jgi:hypothetical protein
VGLIVDSASFTGKYLIVVEISVTIAHPLPRGGTDFISPGWIAMNAKEILKPYS